ncbi:MAG: hypothetical protein BECKG1743E_GA0114224_107763, partial [Candidatus Kentron sp. G]
MFRPGSTDFCPRKARKNTQGAADLFHIFFVLLSVHFLFFMYAFHATISIRSCLEIRVLEVALRLWPCKARWGQ